MKKCIVLAVAGALVMLLVLTVVAVIDNRQKPVPYVHVPYTSEITPDACWLCAGAEGDPHWGEDNVGILNLNTFELLYLEINRYDDQGKRIEEAAGYLSSNSIFDRDNGATAHAFTFPDKGYADVRLSGVQYAIDRNKVQMQLCQTCLDSLNRWADGQPPAEFAVVSFEKCTVQSLTRNRSRFSSGNFGISCDYREKGKIDLLIQYAPTRYS